MSESGSAARVLVIVPAWNEQDSVVATVTEIREADASLDILVIDDGSVDQTSERARMAGALVCRLPFNLGVGGAMRTGYRYALRNGYDVAVQIDADGQHDPTYLKVLIQALDRADVVVGARFADPHDTYRVRGPRKWAMVMLGKVLSWVSGTRITDATSGFRAVNRRGIAVFAAHYPAEYLGDTVESLVIALRTGCLVNQVPVQMRARAAGNASASPVRAAVYLCRAIVALGLALVRQWPADLPDSLAVSPGNRQQVIGRP